MGIEPNFVAATVLAVAVTGVILLLLAVRRLRHRRQDQRDVAVEKVDVASLASEGPPTDGPTLDFYNIPVRLVLVVMAPSGRGAALPGQQQMPEVIESIAPGLMKIFTSHQPAFHRWPPQLSVQGFTQSFFNRIPLPGERGKGTPWCSLAGRVEVTGKPYLFGMICRAAADNSLGETTIQTPGGWLDVLRIKSN